MGERKGTWVHENVYGKRQGEVGGKQDVEGREGFGAR